MRLFIEKIKQYYKENNYDVIVEYEKCKKELIITLTYKKVSITYRYNIPYLNYRLSNFSYDMYNKFIEKIALSVVFDK